jgi:L-arabinonolactonase
MPEYEIARVGDSVDELGEGLLWDAHGQVLYWIDSIGKFIRRLDPQTGIRRDWAVPSEIGAIALRENGGMIAALRDGLYSVDLDSGAVEPVNLIDTGRADQRFNDGAVDRQGRFVVGTMHARAPADNIYHGSLYSIGPDLEETLLEGGIGVANGQSWSPDGRSFYFTDGPKRKIWIYDYGTETGAISNKQMFVDTEPFNSGADGMTIDAEGFLWVAFVNSGKIARFDRSGRTALVIDMPCRMPTNVGFGGPDLDVLYVTSLKQTPNITADGPGAGWLYSITGLGVKGLPETRFNG